MYECIINDKKRRNPSPDTIGGVNLEILTRLTLLEQRLAEVEKRATIDTYGIVRLSDSETVTESEGLALPASEKNATIEGSLANKTYKVEQNFSSLERLFEQLFFFDKAHVSDANDAPAGIYTMDVYGKNNPFTYYCTILTMKDNENSAFAQQLSFPIAAYEANYIAFRYKDGNGWASWSKIWLSTQ